VSIAQNDIKQIENRYPIKYTGLKKYNIHLAANNGPNPSDKATLFIQRNLVWWGNMTGQVTGPLIITYNDKRESDPYVSDRSLDFTRVYVSPNPLLPSVPFTVLNFRRLSGSLAAWIRDPQPAESNNWTLGIDFQGQGDFEVQFDVVVKPDIP
jgi:hypothetical protein